jgi:chondroitin-sulfate-ABC endolyase/exolyase
MALDSFEDGTEGWRADGGKISVSATHWKLGKRSLRWDFTPGGTLRRPTDKALTDALAARAGGVKIWLYCEKPVPGQLRIRVGAWSFPVNLGFTGWRTAWVQFVEDAKPAPAVDGMLLEAPAGAGTIFIDAFELGSVPWMRQGDAQTPYTNPKRANGKYWTTIHEQSAIVPPAPARAVTSADAAAFRAIEGRYEKWMFDRMDDPRKPVQARRASIDSYIARGHAAFEKLGLVRQGAVVTGQGLFCASDTHRPQLASEVLQYVAMPLAYDARLNDSEKARRRFLDLTDYVHDQGWAAGSLMGSSYGDTLRISGYVHAVYILRDYLKAQGRLERELATLHYQISMAATYPVPERPGANADELRTVLLYRLLYILMLEDSPGKLRDMECLVRWANAALSVAHGYGDTIKPDGTVFHHATAYANAYGNNAMLMSSLTYWLLDDTRFALSAEAGANLKRALLNLRFMAGKYHVPMGVSGRWPFSAAAMVPTSPALAYLADALDDEDLGRAFVRLWNPSLPEYQRAFQGCAPRIFWDNSPGALPWLLDAAQRYEPEPEPQGHRAYPYAAMSFHRRRGWVASVRGWSQYVWNYEGNATQNRYGRYSSYGMVQIFARGEPVHPAHSGYRENGWDWLRPPGATVVRVPLTDLATSTVKARQYTRDPFVGGVALGQRHGVWAMRFADPHYETSFRFRKSVFFVDETLVCLGSGISNDDRAHASETILYQTALPTESEPLPRQQTPRKKWLMDPVSNGYYFPEKQAVKVVAATQESMHNSGRKKTKGDFETAWIDHGAAPRQAGYAYAIRPDTTTAAMAAYAAAPDFEILRRDDSAHIVRFPESQVTGYVLFDKTNALSGQALRGADTPCIVMTRLDGDRLHLAVSDPDLRLAPKLTPQSRHQPGRAARLRLYLNGSWQVLFAPPGTRAVDARTLELTCRDGATYEVALKRQ